MSLISFTPSTSYGDGPKLKVTFNATTVCGASPYTVTWVYGDGNRSTQSADNVSWAGATGQEESFIYSHTYTYIGSFIAKIWIIDTAGTNVSGSTPVFDSFTPSLFYSFYNESGLIADGINGSTYSIGLVEECDNTMNYQTDLNTFDTKFDLPPTTLHLIGPGASSCAESGWGPETDLDIQWAHAAAPGAKIYVCLAVNNSVPNMVGCDQSLYLNRNSSSDNTMIVSNSWDICAVGHSANAQTGQGLCVNNTDPFQANFSNYKSAGMNVFASAGDFFPMPCETAAYPASDPSVIAVGGTTVTRVAQGGYYDSEKAWYNSTPVSQCVDKKGGALQTGYRGELYGTTAYYAAPSWQSAVLGNTYRYFPDVSMVGNGSTGVPIVYHGGWDIEGGTSIGSPIRAGILDVLFQAAPSGLSGFAAAFLYGNTNCFHDITNPSGGVDGLGTPNIGCLSKA